MKGKLQRIIVFEPDKVRERVNKALLNPDGSLEVMFVDRLADILETRIRVDDRGSVIIPGEKR